jgi:hypothetical protein
MSTTQIESYPAAASWLQNEPDLAQAKGAWRTRSAREKACTALQSDNRKEDYLSSLLSTFYVRAGFSQLQLNRTLPPIANNMPISMSAGTCWERTS